MKDLLLPYCVCDARYHSAAAGINGSDFQVLFVTNERWEAIAAAKDAGCGACVARVEENSTESVIFVNKYSFDLCLNF